MALVVFALLLLVMGTAGAAPRIGVVTMQPGEIFFERFGHDAIVVQDPQTGRAISYNFGFFDPSESDFVPRFIRGEMRYRLVALPFSQDLAIYADNGRGVSVQWLDLPPDRAQALADALAVNARPENAHYRYDYFLDNCSTRVRDAVDVALGGELRRQLEGRSHGRTYRSEATRLASPAPWMWLAFDIGLGPAADRPLSMWEEAFVPMRLADALAGARQADRNPLVEDRQPLLPHRISPEPVESRPQWPLWALVGVALGIAAAIGGHRRPRLTAALALPVWSVCALLGALMLFIWFGTGHRFGWANHNLLLFNPLCVALLPAGWAIARGRRPAHLFDWLLVAVAAAAVLSLFLHWLPVQPQRNAHWIALILPIHLGLALGLFRRTGVAARAEG
ncbi:DUF4105 domain-containing protein [Lysobacter korlensis]|uniref:DUF4105 domain-containing protein n=1 Tax=Lysobacter korlensis TaxID=553636 RepID=A0ABV6RSG1_9GAMM